MMSSAEQQQHIRAELAHIKPLDATEQAHLDDALAWVASGAPLFRSAKPATPPVGFRVGWPSTALPSARR